MWQSYHSLSAESHRAVAPLGSMVPHLQRIAWGMGFSLSVMALVPCVDCLKRCFCFDFRPRFASSAVTINDRIIEIHIKSSNFRLFAAKRATFRGRKRLELVHHTRPVFSGLEMYA